VLHSSGSFSTGLTEGIIALFAGATDAGGFAIEGTLIIFPGPPLIQNLPSLVDRVSTKNSSPSAREKLVPADNASVNSPFTVNNALPLLMVNEIS
jgi:hypothetical protein